MSTIGVRLRELRGETSQSEMARGVNVKQQNWARWESGIVSPSAEMLAEICRVHDCSADWLLGLKDRGTSVNAGAGAAVAIGANARASARTSVAPPGDRPDCVGCPYKEKMKEFEVFFNTINKKGKKK